MRKFLLTLILVITQFSIATEPRVVKVGAFDDFPLIYQDKNGKVDGLYVEILNEIGKKEHISFKFVFGTWQDGLDWIKSGEVDMLTDVGYLPERDEYMDYCKVPLMTFWGELYTSQSSSIGSLLDIENKSVGVLKGDIFYKYFQDLTTKFNINCRIIELDSYGEIFKSITEGKVDAGVAAGLFKMEEKRRNGLKPTGFVFNPIDVFFTTGKGKNADLREILDKHLKIWEKDENQFLVIAKQKWLPGTIKAVEVIPLWLKNSMIILGFILISGLTFIFLLKIQVKRATAEIIKREKEIKESEEKFRQLIWDMQVGVLLQGPQAEIIMSNPRALDLLGLTENQLLGKSSFDPDWNVIHEDGTPFPGAEHPVPQAIATLQPVRNIVMGVYRPLTMDRAWLLVDAIPQLNTDGTIRQVVCTFIDITERKQLEDTQAFLLHSGYINSTENFFDQVARFLADKLNMDYVCIDKLSGDMLSAQTVSVFFDGKFEDNLEYTLHDTPCGEVAGKNICSFEEGVRHRFPNDQVLQDMNAESYLGVTLWGSNAKAIGLIAVIGRKPLKNKKLAEAILKQVAIRSAWELERIAADEALMESEEIFNQFLQHCPVYVFFKDEQIRTLKLSANFAPWLGRPLEELIGKSMDDLFPSDFAKKIVADDMKIIQEGKVVTLEEEFNGRLYTTIKFPFQTVNQKKYLAGFTIDITEQKTAQLKLQEQADDLKISNNDLSIFNQVAISRELRMIELKKEINALCLNAGLPERYQLDFAE